MVGTGPSKQMHVTMTNTKGRRGRLQLAGGLGQTAGRAGRTAGSGGGPSASAALQS